MLDYTTTYRSMETLLRDPTGGDAAKGKKLADKFCMTCHLDGRVGPVWAPGLYEPDWVVRRVRLAQGAFALGQTLTALNLRALTGASVVAIHRAGGDVVLPTGRERLEEGDTLALAGPPGSLDDGQHLLVSGPSPVERVSSVTSSEG